MSQELYGTAVAVRARDQQKINHRYEMYMPTRNMKSKGFSKPVFQKPCCAAGRVSMVRELHVYGTAVAVHARDQQKFQHQGYGSLLMREAERIARLEHRSTKLAVISGVGTRHYYRKLGYHLEGPYMVKMLDAAPSRRRCRGSVLPVQLAAAVPAC